MLLHVLPRLPISCAENSWFRYTEHLCKSRASTRIAANFLYKLLCQFCLWLSISVGDCSVEERVGFVLFLGSPSKIVKSVVRWISISMATIMRWSWSGACKCLKNYYMDSLHLYSFPSCGQRKNEISIFCNSLDANSGFYVSVAPSSRYSPTDASNLTVIRYLIESFVSNNCAPFFLHNSPPQVSDPHEGRGNRCGFRRSAAKPSRAGGFYSIRRVDA